MRRLVRPADRRRGTKGYEILMQVEQYFSLALERNMNIFSWHGGLLILQHDMILFSCRVCNQMLYF